MNIEYLGGEPPAGDRSERMPPLQRMTLILGFSALGWASLIAAALVEL